MPEGMTSRSLVRRIAGRLTWEVSHRLKPKPEWLKKKERVDREFDASYGVDTGGYTYLRSLKISSPNRQNGHSHIAADPEEFAAAIAALDVDLSRFTFIDLGSGKGRALMLASEYPFECIIGVEFAESLVEIARRNIKDSRIETLYADVTEYELPPVPTILFLYNPFGEAIMDVVAQRTAASLVKSPRELLVLYLNPFFEGSWLKAGFEQIHRGEHFAIFTAGSRKQH